MRVTIERTQGRGPGVIRCRGRSWLLVQVIDDLRVDGWECLRRRDVIRLTRSSGDRFAERVLAADLQASPRPQLDLDSTFGLLASLHDAFACFDLDEPPDFVLGRVEALSRRSARFSCLDADGTSWWNVSVPIARLSRIHLGSHYASTYLRAAEGFT